MAASLEGYEKWLTERLLSANPDADTDVFVSYISGILEEETSEDEKKESILDLLSQVVEDGQEGLCEELIKQWSKMFGEKQATKDKTSDLHDHLSNILEHQKIEGVKTKEMTAEEKERKAAILAAYSTVESGDEDDSSDEGNGSTSGAAGGKGDDLLDFKNTNMESVKIIEAAKREQAKQEAEKKREKDKQDREEQKQKQKERKEGEKKRTQKGERRR